MSRKVLLVLLLTWGMVSTSYGVVVGDFEDAGLDGWWSDDGTLSQSATGATVGASAMQSDLAGGWKQAAMMDAKAYRSVMVSGSTVSADITISAMEGGTWLNSEMVINGQDNDDNGANNNIDWNSLGQLDLVRDGSTNTYEWTIGSALADAIAASDDSIVWFELVIVENNDGNSISINVDNVQINPPPTEAVVGNFEDAGLDGWTSDGTISQGTVGVTLDSSSMKVVAGGGWQAVGKLDAKPWRTLMGTGVMISADITVIDTDVVGASWINVEAVVNGQNNDDNGVNNNLDWNPLGTQDLILDGQPHTYTWAINQLLSDAIAATDDTISWFEIFIVVNNDGTSVIVYIDNVQIFQPEPPDDEPVGVVVGDFETDLDGWWTADGDSTITQVLTGASTGSGALQIEDAGDWKIGARLDAKPYMSILGSAGAKVTMDVSVSSAEMPDWSLNVGVTINAQDNDDNGANNNLGWREVGPQQAVAVTGSLETVELTFELDDQLIADIAAADLNIGWFELLITKNSGAGKFYVDNIQVWPKPDPPSYPYGYLFSDFEIPGVFDGWGGWDGVYTQSATGATSGALALQSDIATGGWHGHGQTDGLLAYRAMLASGARIVADITVFPEDVPGATWMNAQMVINGQNNDDNGANNNIAWLELSGLDLVRDGVPHTYEWVLPADVQQTIAGTDDNLGWLQLVFITNNDATATRIYLDNIWIYIPSKATYPTPADGATEVECITTASWLRGGGALEHDVFLSTNQAALNEVDIDNLASYPDVMYFNTLDPSVNLPKLDVDTPHWWRVDEVEDSNDIITGDIWSFTVANNILIDDFESYLDSADLFATWVDSNSLSTEIANLGSQSMLLTANNTKSPFYSEATVSLSDDYKDLTQSDMAAMELYFRGDPNNAPELMYVRVVDGEDQAAVVTYSGDPQDIKSEVFQVWRITLADFGGVDLTNVATVSIGIGNRDNPTAGGIVEKLYIDDIRLFPARCILEMRDSEFARIDFAPLGVNPGDCIIDLSELMILAGDYLKTDDVIPAGVVDPNEAGGRVAYYKFDIGQGTLAIADSNDPTPEGTFHNGVTWVEPGYDGTGYAINIDGAEGSRVGLGTWDPSAGTGELSLSVWVRWAGSNENDNVQGIIGKRNGWALDEMKWFFETGSGGGIRLRQYGESGVDVGGYDNGLLDPFMGRWIHLAVTFDGTTARIYLNGVEVESGPFEFGTMDDASMAIGNVHDADWSSETFMGDIDEVQIFNRALTPLEVAYLADLTRGDGELYVPIGSVADISSDEPAGQKSINLKDLAVLALWWMDTDLAVVFD